VFNFASRQKGSNTYTLKNADGKVIDEYTPQNDFTYLIIAGDELVPGDYTFWQGTTQLTGSSMKNMQGGMPQGERPERPQGEQDEKGTPPEVPDGMERPEPPSDEPPQMPNGERPEMHEGMENMTPPDNMGGMMGDNMMPNGETSTTFTLAKGGNQFANVCPVRN
jgi:hypothetical protein